MGRVKDWMMDEEEKAADYWLALHPGKTPEDAWYALHGDDYEPDFEERAVPTTLT